MRVFIYIKIGTIVIENQGCTKMYPLFCRQLFECKVNCRWISSEIMVVSKD